MATTSTPQSASPPQAAGKSRPRLHYLDGIRGLAAVFVVFNHLHKDILARTDAANLPHWFWAFSWMHWGHYSVDIFIVLSGYCLMLPVAQTATQELRGGVLEFVKRRARRIVPPYYAALALSLLLIALIPGLKHPVGGVPSDTFHLAVPAFTAQAVVPHILLIHNLKDEWTYKINSPMWSVATEWQIYFVFALVLLPVWRRFGWTSAVAAAIVLGYAPHFLPHRKLDVACPWFLALFGMGMAAAAANFGRLARPAGEKHPVPWGAIAAINAGVVIFVTAWKPIRTEIHFYLVDFFVGIATACMLIACTRRLQQDETKLPLGLRILAAPATVGLGMFSYTIYLIHRPILLAIEALYTRANMSPITEFWTLLFAGVPMVLLISYGFHLLFERRFMNVPAKQK